MRCVMTIGVRALPILLGALLVASGAQAASLADLVGTWSGGLTNHSGAAAPIIFHVMADGTGTLDSPAQDVFGVVVVDLMVEHNVVSFSSPKSGFVFNGMLEGDLSAIDGQWEHKDNTLPLRLVRRNVTPQP